MNFQELITKITKSILDNITPYLQDTLKRDKTFKAKVTEVIKDGKVKILYSGKIHTASTTLPCELNDMVRVCVPNGNWQDLYVVENRSKGRTIRDMFNNLNNVTKRVDGMITNGEAAVSCTHEWNGTVLTVTSASGTSSADLKGETGKSAYEYALDGGYAGTEEDFAEKNAQEIYTKDEIDESMLTINNDLTSVKNQSFPKLTDFARNKTYKIATFRYGGNVELLISPFGDYGGPSAIVNCTSFELTVLSNRRSTSTAYEKRIVVYRTGSNYSDYVFHVYMICPNYNEGITVTLLNSYTMYTFEKVDVTDTYSSEISGKTLVADSQGTKMGDYFYSATFSASPTYPT